MYDFNQIYNLNQTFKSLLETSFGLIYIEEKIENLENDTGNTKDLSLFEISKNKESIFLKIKSPDTLEDVKKEIKEYYEKFSKNYLDYFERVEDQLNEKDQESFVIIDKTIKSRGKKLNSTIKKFKIEDNWNISKIQEEFYFKLQKNLKDIIDSLIQPISTGIKENTAYDGILKVLNEFLSTLGIYTVKFEINQETDNNILEPQHCDDCETKDLEKKDKIKEILTYPYILNDKQIISEGKVILWKISNGR